MTRTSNRWASGTADYIWGRDQGICVYCGEPGQVIDHVLPVAYGGPTTRGNGVVACTGCNMRKRGLQSDWIEKGFAHLGRVGEDLTWMDPV